MKINHENPESTEEIKKLKLKVDSLE